MGIDVSGDTQTLLMLPRAVAKGLKAMYAYDNHIRVQGAKGDLATCDSLIAATFLQSVSSSNRKWKATNLEYVEWVEKNLSVDYERSK